MVTLEGMRRLFREVGPSHGVTGLAIGTHDLPSLACLSPWRNQDEIRELS